MIEKLKKVDNTDFPYTDENSVSWSSKSSYLQIEYLGFCGCGDPTSAMILIRDILNSIKEGGTDQTLFPSDGLYYFMLYWLDDKGFTEHGTSIHGCWLTDLGKEILNDINWCLENEKEE